ncbi:MAG: InlB B-repeat-containing protein [Acutalibacteraceae bacterium]
MKPKRKIISLLLCAAMLLSLCPTSVFAEAAAQDSGIAIGASGLCEHHTEHNEDCGYTEGTTESPCTHEHSEDCYTLVKNCVHSHTEDCYPQETVSGNVAAPPDGEEREPENCAHICSEENGCIKEELDCKHEHSEDCGYAPATDGTPCGFVCKECNPVDSGDQPETAVTVESVQAMIDALPVEDEISEGNAEEVQAQLAAIDEAMAELTDEEAAQLDMTRYLEAAAALEGLHEEVATPANAIMLANYDGLAIVLGADHLEGGQASNVYFGNYKQSSDGNGSFNVDPVKWRVLSNTSGSLFLLADQNLDVQKYHNIDNVDKITWEGCSLRKWLKGTFYNSAFSAKEQTAIAETHVVNDDNPDYKTEGGNDTKDKIFLLSIDEASNSSLFPPTGYDCCQATNTAYVDNHSGMSNYPRWWLRGPGYYESYAAHVTNFGYVNVYGHNIDNRFCAVRPVFNLDLSSVLFTSAAVGGKQGDGLEAIGDYSGNEWKLTLLDTTRKFSVKETTAIEKPGETITLNYSGATTGANEYISAIIADNSGTQYYGRIMQPSSADGQISIKIPSNLADGTYTLNVFNEQYNGGEQDNTKLTDYASAFEVVALTIDNTPPTISGSAIRDSEAAATVTFSSSETGEYYYEVVESGAAEPNIDTTAAGIACDTTEQTISLTSLTAGAKDIYIVVKDAVGNVSRKQKVEIPASALPAPQNLQWNSDTPGKATATWDTVTNARGYSVQLYKDGVAEGNADTTTETEYEFTIDEADTYTFMVKAIGEDIYSDSPESSHSTALTFYAVSFDVNGGIGDTIDAQTVVDGGHAEVPNTDALTKTGHTLAGWYKDSGLKNEYIFGIGTISATTTLYAKWERNTYKVTLVRDGGTIHSGNVESYTYGVGATLPTDVTKEDFTFMGWYADSSFTDPPVTGISATDIGEKTFYAKWLSNNTDVQSVTIGKTTGEIDGTSISVVLPYGTKELPTDGNEFSIATSHERASASTPQLAASSDSEWTFTVTAEDGKTEQPYTILVSIAPDPTLENQAAIKAAISVVENHEWTVAQATANTEETVKKWIEGQLATMELNGASYTVTLNGITPATAGTAGDRDGTNGSFAFTVKLFKGENTGDKATSTYAEKTTKPLNGTITATPYTKWTITLNAGNGGTVSGGGTFEENEVITVTATPNSGYRFVRWEEGGAQASDKASYSFPVLADRTLTAVFERRSSGGGGGGGSSTTTYTLTFDTNGGSKIDTFRTSSYGKTVDLSDYTPTREGYDFNGWYADKALTEKITSIRLNGNKTVYAGWTKQAVPVDPADPDKENPSTGGSPFTDVKESDWFYEAVMFVYEKEIMVGTSDTTFSPYGTATRGMMAAIIWRMEGSPKAEYSGTLKDVPKDSYYAEAVKWTMQQGIFSGYGGGLFGPDDPITRQQLAAIFYNYAKYKGYDLTPTDSLSGFTDGDKVAGWAQDAMKWAVGSGLMNGKGDGILDPQGTATRAEIAAMLHRFIEKYQLVEGVAPGGMTGWIDPRRTLSPQTGDNTNITLWAGMFLFSAMALAVTLYTIRRRDNDETPFPT